MNISLSRLLIRTALYPIFVLILSLYQCSCSDEETNAGGGTDCAPSSTQQNLLDLINQQRGKGTNCGGYWYPATSKLILDCQLQVAAQKHSNDMAVNNFLDHTGSDGSDFYSRAKAAGTQANAENIAYGATTADDVLLMWLDSPAHCVNLMGEFKLVGVGFSDNNKNKIGFWTLLLQ